MVDKVKEIDNEIRDLHNRKFALQKKQFRKRLPELKKEFIGKCYKYRNSYGSGRKWWLYKKITNVIMGYGPDDECSFETVSFQISSDNRFEAENRTLCRLDDSYIEITSKQFQKASEKFLNELSKKIIKEVK